MSSKSPAPSRPASGPPRSAWAGGKKAALSVPSTAAAATAELKQKGEALERSLRSEELARNAAQLERNKIQAFWDITRRQLGDARAELLVKDRELEEEEDRHGLELKVYKQRVRHLLYEHAAHVARLKADAEAALKAQGEVWAAQEAQLDDDKRRLRQHVREQELSGEELLKQFRLDNAKQASKMRADFEAQARRIQAKYEAQLRELHTAAEDAYAADLADQEQRAAAHVAALTAGHEEAIGGMRAYFAKVTAANLDLIRALKEEIAGMRAAEAQRERLVVETVRENKALAEPLGKARQEANVLREQLAGVNHDRAALAATKARLAVAEQAGRAREWELEVTRQRLEKVEAELRQLRQRHEALALQALQRGALRAQLQAAAAAQGAKGAGMITLPLDQAGEAEGHAPGGEAESAAQLPPTGDAAMGSAAGTSAGGAMARQHVEERPEKEEEVEADCRGKEEQVEEEGQQGQPEGVCKACQPGAGQLGAQQQQESGQPDQQESGQHPRPQGCSSAVLAAALLVPLPDAGCGDSLEECAAPRAALQPAAQAALGAYAGAQAAGQDCPVAGFAAAATENSAAEAPAGEAPSDAAAGSGLEEEGGSSAAALQDSSAPQHDPE